MNSFTKFSGWLLILAGFSIIIFTLWSSYNIFSAKAAVPEFFQKPEEIKNSSSPAAGQEIQAQLQQAVQDQLKNIIPIDFIVKTMNLSVWSILALILMSGGSRISDLGIKLIKIGQENNEHV